MVRKRCFIEIRLSQLSNMLCDCGPRLVDTQIGVSCHLDNFEQLISMRHLNPKPVEAQGRRVISMRWQWKPLIVGI